MSNGDQRIRALCLLSGSVDSQLAASLLREQGMDLCALACTHPFFDGADARPAAERLGIELNVVDISAACMRALAARTAPGRDREHPLYLFRRVMLETALAHMASHACHVLCTGDVLNQEEITQGEAQLDRLALESGVAGRILRPLSGRRRSPTFADAQGWIERERFLDVEGSSRKGILHAARERGIEEDALQKPGRRLKDPVMVERIRDALEHGGIPDARALVLLGVGRHFRLRPGVKLIVGRDEVENAALEGAAELYDLVLKFEDVPGPTGLLPFTATDEDIGKASEICARYSDHDQAGPARVRVRSARDTRWFEVRPATQEHVEQFRL